MRDDSGQHRLWVTDVFVAGVGAVGFTVTKPSCVDLGPVGTHVFLRGQVTDALDLVTHPHLPGDGRTIRHLDVFDLAVELMSEVEARRLTQALE